VFKLMLFLTALMLSAVINASGLSCQERYDSAVTACKTLPDFCMDISICKDIRKSCPQNIGDMASCNEFNQCARKNTPALFTTVCRYEWNGLPTTGSCENTNGMMERITTTCPGYSLKLSSSDPDYNCMGQINRFKSSQHNCIAAIHYYYRTCPSDPYQPTISVKTCEEADLPLPKSKR